ncbi:MAG: Holliday junction resolvase RuvX [Pseudomonadales bacterium]|nr:Holliday junction resolvase RuvX [Pseudomonadales bacterium]
MSTDTVIAFDFGLRYTGVAIGQTLTGTARGVATLRCRDGKPKWYELNKIVDEFQPQRLIVGLPLHMDGQESEMSELARAFAEQLRQRYRLEITLQDERLTSKIAALKLADAKDIGIAQTDHELAACMICNDWLQQQAS